MLIGCATIGPESIRSGRMAYNEAITETNNQQMLMVFVHNRYEESNHLLAVSSVTANVSMSSRATIQAGFGDGDDYDGNLVPFSGGFIYEENPTISYTPVTGETYLRQLTSSVPLQLLAQTTQSFAQPEYAYRALLSSVNDIRNPSFLFGSQQDDPRFDHLVTLMVELTHLHALHWMQQPGNPSDMSLVITPPTTEAANSAKKLLALLGLPDEIAQKQERIIPVFTAGQKTSAGGIIVRTNTILNFVEILSAAVQVPPQDELDGIAASSPRPGRAGRDIQIRYANSRPESAYVAVEHREGWFYIGHRDLATKRYFKLLGSLWSAAMSHAIGATSSTPVLTVPVSR